MPRHVSAEAIRAFAGSLEAQKLPRYILLDIVHPEYLPSSHTMTAKQSSTATARLVCLCGAIALPGSLVKADSFPIPSGICSCNLCRKVTGGLCTTAVAVEDVSNDALQPFTSYKATENITCYFCGTCGSKVLVHDRRLGWYATAGNIDRHDDQRDVVDTVELKWSMQSDDTADGGLLRRMAEISYDGMKDLKCFRGDFKTELLALSDVQKVWYSTRGDETKPDQETLASTDTEQHGIPLSCHCGSISLRILPATKRNPETSSTYFDRYTRDDGTKYVAKVCCCRSDRLSFGTLIVPWTYVFPECIQSPNGDHISFSSSSDYSTNSFLRTLRSYNSSAEAKRSFCGRCGATVFYEHKNRPQIINVAPGLLDANSGALAQDILSWDWERVSWPDECECNAWLESITGSSTMQR